MDIFKFRNPTSPTKMQQGEIINGLKSKMWIERYRESGEFTLVAGIESDVREKLPLGTFISHVDTDEIMIVDNHEISENRGQPTNVTITGRGFETILDQRTIGMNRAFPVIGSILDYIVNAGLSANQVVDLINGHILPTYLINADDEIPYITVVNQVVGIGTSFERSLRVGSLYDGVMELLALDNLGIRVIRPGASSPLLANPDHVALVVHFGVDRSKQVVFSNDTGEIESADYLWSNRQLKTTALVTGRWVHIRVDDPAYTDYARRMMHVDASDIDDYFEVAPTGTDLTDVQSRMEQRGLTALANKKILDITKAEVSKENRKNVYRKDYQVGDLVTVSGDYKGSKVMRVTEFVEIEDEHGQSSYPTLTTD